MNESYKIAIASGKGGTGKTTVSVNLYHSMCNNGYTNIQLVDCDVEEPNDAIFFPDKVTAAEQKEISQLIPEIDTDKCSFCRKCVEYCEFNAIVVLPPVQFAEVNPSLCHSCGACSYACQFDAITEQPVPIGQVAFYDTGYGKGLVEGKLKIGSAMQTMMIKETKKLVSPDNQVTLYDAPPGTSCPLVETVADVDYVILVTEPTPFGLHDLKLTVDLLKEIEIPFGVIINKAGLGDQAVYTYLQDENIELLGEIPFSQEFASRYANGLLLDGIDPEMADYYKVIIQKLERRMAEHA